MPSIFSVSLKHLTCMPGTVLNSRDLVLNPEQDLPSGWRLSVAILAGAILRKELRKRAPQGGRERPVREVDLVSGATTAGPAERAQGLSSSLQEGPVALLLHTFLCLTLHSDSLPSPLHPTLKQSKHQGQRSKKQQDGGGCWARLEHS